ncbi:short-chain-enoyl-CoA hydratase [soil metagenome]
MSDTYPHPNLAITDLGAVQVLRVDREEALGALSTELVHAIDAVLADLETRRDVRCVVLTGTGRGFIAGADIKEYATASSEVFDEYQRFSRSVFERLATLPQVTIAAVNGYAFGGGFELAMACDFIVASESARFALPEVKLGLVPGGGGILRLADAGGTRWAKDVIISGRTVYPEEALERDVVSRVVPAGELLDVAIAWARDVATRAPGAVRAIKSLMADDERQTAAAAAAERSALVSLFGSRDGREGIRAFVEKREAEFTDE